MQLVTGKLLFTYTKVGSGASSQSPFVPNPGSLEIVPLLGFVAAAHSGCQICQSYISGVLNP